MKIFNSILNKNLFTTPLKKKASAIGKTKYLPSFSKEWKNIIYSYNKETLKNIPTNDININKIIKSYFNLYFKDSKFAEDLNHVLLQKRRRFLQKIYISDAEIKHTSNKAIVTLYIFNKERKLLRNKYLLIKKRINKSFWSHFTLLYKNKEYEESNLTQKKIYALKWIENQNKQLLTELIDEYSKKNLPVLKKYDLLYSLNENKFNKFTLLPILTYYLEGILGKKIEYNIINLKSIIYSPDFFTNFLTLKLKKKQIFVQSDISNILSKTHLPIVNKIKERISLKGSLDKFMNSYKNLNIISNMFNVNFNKLLNNVYHSNLNYNNAINKIHKLIFNSIRYKNLGGIRLEVSGRLTKRYRADRSIHLLNWKGGLKNIDSSFKRLNTIAYRGNVKSNNAYSWSKSKRRIGSFAIKGWISGK